MSPKIIGLHAKPSFYLNISLAVLPFLLVIGIYVYGSQSRHEENPNDRLLPTVSKMATSIKSVAFDKDKRTGNYILWSDTFASLKRMGIGIALASVIGMLLGLNIGLFPGLRAFAQPLVLFISIVPPLAVLPILFIVFGVDELSKIMLIFLGTCPLITRDIILTVNKTPREQIVKSLTLGASQLQVVYKIMLPQIMPRLLDTMRLQLGPAWLFLIAAEAITSMEGLGYRIFLVRRYMDMATIIPYVLWITFLGVLMDLFLKKMVSVFYPWYAANK